MHQPSIPAEERGSLAEPTRFGTLARRVFHPLLSTEADQ
jgi:exodeoxyribonuclease V gamma subunit